MPEEQLEFNFTKQESGLNIYLLRQNVNNEYDTYDSVVVCAETLDQAKLIHPSKVDWDGTDEELYGTWCSWEHVDGMLLGKASADMKKGVVLSSFNAG